MKKLITTISLCTMILSGVTMMMTGCSSSSDDDSLIPLVLAKKQSSVKNVQPSETPAEEKKEESYQINVYLITDGLKSQKPMVISNLKVKTVFEDLEIYSDEECTKKWDESKVSTLYVKLETQEVVIAKVMVFKVLDGVCETTGTEAILKKATALYSSYSLCIDTDCKTKWDGTTEVEKLYYAVNTIKVYTVKDGVLQDNPVDVLSDAVKTTYTEKVYSDKEGKTEWDGDISVKNLYIIKTSEAKELPVILIAGDFNSAKVATNKIGSKKAYFDVLGYDPDTLKAYGGGATAGAAEDGTYTLIFKVYGGADGSTKICSGKEELSKAIGEKMNLTTGGQKNLKYTGIKKDSDYRIWIESTSEENGFIVTMEELKELPVIVMAGDFSSSKLALTADGKSKAYYDIKGYNPETLKAYGGGATAGAAEDGTYTLIFKAYAGADGSIKICSGSEDLIAAYGESMFITTGGQKNLRYTGIKAEKNYRITIESTSDENAFVVSILEIE